MDSRRVLKVFLPAVFIVVGLVIIIGLNAVGAENRIKERAILNINGRPLYVEIASTPEQRQKGLMFRKHLGENEGMLFVFEKEKILSFWMKDTYIPLSIAFIDKNGVIVNIFDMKPFSLKPVVSTLKCKYALEVNRGFFRRCGVEVGDKIDLNGIYR